MKRILLAFPGLVLGLAILSGAACAGGEKEAAPTPAVTATPAPGDPQAVVAAAIRAPAEAFNAGDLEGFLALVTENFLGGTKQEVRDAFARGDFTPGEPPIDIAEISNVRLSGDSATADVTIRQGATRTGEKITVVKQGDTWLLDRAEPARIPAPEGATEVEVSLVEFAFNFDRLSFPAGDVAFQARNDGQQEHEMVIFSLPEGITLQQFLETEDPFALGVQFIASFSAIQPGREVTWIVEGLVPGRYGYACYVPDADDPEGTHHALKGMAGEFTVQ